MKVAVVAHSGKTLGGGLLELRRVLGPTASPIRSGTRCRRAARRPQQVRRAVDAGRRARLRVGRRRDGPALRRCAGRLGRDARDRPGRHREPLRLQPGDPARTSSGRSRSGSRRTPQARRRPLQRGALRGDGRGRLRRRDDPRRRRTAVSRTDSAALAYVWTGRRTCARSRSARDHGRRRRLVQGQGELHPARQRRQALRRDRGIRGRPPRRRATRGRGRDRRRAHRMGSDARAPRPSARRAGRRSCTTHEGPLGEGQADRKVLYELDGGDRTKVKSFKVKVEPGAIASAFPGDA